MSRIDDHFDEMTGLLYLEKQLDADHARDIAAHLEGCAKCRALLRALEAEGVWLREALTAEDESVPARLLAAPGKSSTQWGWLAAFGLCLVGVYTFWTDIAQPWISQAAQSGWTQDNLITMLLFRSAFWKGWDAMRILTELFAVATLGTLAVWLLRRQWRRFTPVAFVMGVLALALSLSPSASAADIERGDPSYVLPAGQEVKNDLIVFADRVEIDGDVDGDLIVFSRSVTVNGHIKGDIIGFVTELRVGGPVDGNVRATCQTLTLNNTVTRNVMAWAGDFEMEQKAKIGGTLTVGSSNMLLSGEVDGDLLALSPYVEIDGSLMRDVVIRGDRLRVGPTASIKGKTSFAGRRQPEISQGAKMGPIEVTVPKRGPDYAKVSYYRNQVLLWGASFLFGLAVLLMAPGFFYDATQAARRLGPAVGFGALFLFATPIAAIIACFTIVGLGVGIAAILLYAIAIYAAQLFVGAWIGQKLLGPSAGVGPAIGQLALGLGILHALVMLPYVSGLIALVVAIWGMGALVLAVHKHMRPQTEAPAA